MGVLVDLVADGILGGRGAVSNVSGGPRAKEVVVKFGAILPSGDGVVAVLGDVLVGLLGDTGGSALDGLLDVLGGLLSSVHCDCCLKKRLLEMMLWLMFGI